MLNAFTDLLCSKLCWHNWQHPTRITIIKFCTTYLQQKQYIYQVLVSLARCHINAKNNMGIIGNEMRIK